MNATTKPPLPVERLKDGGKHGKGSDYQWTCFGCMNWRKCERLKVATMKQTVCNFSPSRFKKDEEIAKWG